MNELINLQNFNYEGKAVRTIQKEGAVWWVLKDICEVLELSNPSMVAERLDEDERAKLDLGRQGETNIINESGLYNVIMRSDKQEAKKFKKWVTSEVLPAIRKHGGYLTATKIEEVLLNPDAIISLAMQLKQANEEKAKLAEALAEKTLQLDESQEWLTVKRVASLNNKHWKSFDWKRLKNTSHYMGYPVKQVFDANYGYVNSYHIDVWKHEYSGNRFYS